MRTPSLREKADYERRIDSLLDEMAELRNKLQLCTELDDIGTKAATDALEICTKTGVELAARLLVMQRFISACAQTGYRPEAWELKLVLDAPMTGESLT